MRQAFRHHQRGLSVVEVLIALGLAAVIVASVGNALAAANRAGVASGNRDQASALAQEVLEVVTSIQAKSFACSASNGGVIAGSTCTIGAQNCTLLPGYASCWTTLPPGLGNGPYYIHKDVSGRYLLDNNTFAQNHAPIDSDPSGKYWHSVAVSNINGDANRKLVTATIGWTEHELSKSLSLSTVLTGWRNTP
jgi:Tfp pilus assembly protein PilV